MMARFVVPILSVLIVAAFSITGWSVYNGHRSSCNGRDTTLDVMRDVIVIAARPQPGERRTAAEKARTAAFERSVFARINQARC